MVVLLMAEIRRLPVDMANIPLFTGFYTSQMVQDFFHQQYFWDGTLKNQTHIYLNIVGIYWVYPLLKGSLGG